MKRSTLILKLQVTESLPDLINVLVSSIEREIYRLGFESCCEIGTVINTVEDFKPAREIKADAEPTES